MFTWFVNAVLCVNDMLTDLGMSLYPVCNPTKANFI